MIKIFIKRVIIIIIFFTFFANISFSQDRIGDLLNEAEKYFFSKRYNTAINLLNHFFKKEYIPYDEAERAYLFMALCYKKKNKRYLAETELEEALEINPNITLDSEKFDKDLIDFVERIKEEIIGEVYIVSNPPGASVYINGRFKGEAPLLIKHIYSGIKAIVFKEGYEVENRFITIFPRETTKLNINLKWNDFSNTMIINTEPELVAVFIDKNYIGESPLIVTGLSPGRYRLTLERPGYYTKEELVILRPRTIEELNIKIIKIKERFILSELFPGLGQFTQGYPKHGIIFSTLWTGYMLLYKEKVNFKDIKYQSCKILTEDISVMVLSNGEIFTKDEWRRLRSRERARFDRKKRNMILLGLGIYIANLVDMSWILWYDKGKILYEEQKKFGIDFKCDNNKVEIGLTIKF